MLSSQCAAAKPSAGISNIKGTGITSICLTPVHNTVAVIKQAGPKFLSVGGYGVGGGGVDGVYRGEGGRASINLPISTRARL